MLSKRNVCGSFILLFMALIIFGNICHAETILRKKNIHVSAEYENDEHYNITKLSLPQTGIVNIRFYFKLKNETAPVLEQGFSLDLLRVKYNEEFTKQDYNNLSSNITYDDLFMTMIETEDLGGWTDTFYDKRKGYTYTLNVDFGRLAAGDYILQFLNGTGYDLTLEYEVMWYPGYVESLSVPSDVTIKEGTTYLLKTKALPQNSLLTFEKIYTSNNKAVSAEFLTNGIQIKAKKAGKYKLYIRLKNNRLYSVNLNITKSNKTKLKYASYNLYKGQSFTNKLLNNSKKVTWLSSNKKVATVTTKGKITAKVGKKKYTCTVKVNYRKPDFYACLTDYDRTRNYFTIRIKNNTNKAITVYSAGAKAIDDTYKSFNRNLKLSKNRNVTIKGKKTKVLKFYVKGSRTWYDYTDFDILYKVKFDEKIYECLTNTGCSEYKRSKKATYSSGKGFYSFLGIYF